MAANSYGLAPLLTPAGEDLTATQAPRIIATSIVLMIISAIAVALRFIARHLSEAGLWWDDWTILGAMVLTWGECISMIIGTNHGFGQHSASQADFATRISNAQLWFKNFYAYETIYTVAIFLAKMSILLFYSRIFKERKFLIALRTTFALVIGWFVAVEIVVLAECRPVAALWDPTITGGYCIDIHNFLMGAGIPNVILNVIVLLLPMPMIWTLEIERKHKIALSSVFMLGGFVIIVSIVRVVVLARTQTEDVTWEFVDAGVWTSVEPAIAVCSACLPILRSLWIWRRQKTSARRSEARGTQKSHIESLKSFSKVPEKSRPESYGSRYPLNELPADNEIGWGSKKRTSGHSSKPSDGFDEDIQMTDLPTAKQKTATPSYKISDPYLPPKGRPAELYG